MDSADREFDYRPPWKMTVLAIVVFGACGFGGAAMATSNEKGLLINNLIELSPGNATRFQWGLCALSFAMAAIGVLGLVMRVVNPQKILLATDGYHAPKWRWSRQTRFVRYAGVQSLDLNNVAGEDYLKVVHADGKDNLMANMFKSRSIFYDFYDELRQRHEAK